MNPDPLIGTQLGNYRITAQLGEGGMARVYRATNPDIGREAAVKVLASDFAHVPDVVRRFRTEAQAVNKIDHPNIVEIFDFGTLPDGRPYFLMELLSGESLADRIRRAGAMTVPEALAVIDPMLAALEAVHAAGIVHRDLKPDNVFLAREGVKLLDFGIAKLTDTSMDNRTRTGALMGTPAYMAPEQCEGKHHEVGAPTDVYAVGCILYEMLAGSVPFDAQSLGGLIKQHMMVTPRPLVERVLDLPAGLSEIVARCLAKEPSHRPQSAAELRSALARLYGGSHVAATIVAPATAATVATTAPTGTPSSKGPALGSPASTGGPSIGKPNVDVARPTPTPPSAAPMSPTPAPEPKTVVLPPRPEPPAPPAKSKAPIAIVAALVLAGAGAAVFFVTRGSAPPLKPDAAIDAPKPIDAAVDAPKPIDAAPPPDATPDAIAIDAPLTLQERLETLKKLCTEGQFTPAECADRRQQILDEWSRQH